MSSTLALLFQYLLNCVEHSFNYHFQKYTHISNNICIYLIYQMCCLVLHMHYLCIFNITYKKLIVATLSC